MENKGGFGNVFRSIMNDLHPNKFRMTKEFLKRVINSNGTLVGFVAGVLAVLIGLTGLFDKDPRNERR